jgi:hypothetical protein
MPIKQHQRGGKKLHKLLCDFVTADNPMTTAEIYYRLDRSKTHILRAMKYLAERGYFKISTPGRFQTITWVRTDKEYVYEPKSTERTVCPTPKPKKLDTILQQRKIEITIKPDLAAMWLVSSKPPWEKRSIPIVRSIGLGARQNTL